MKMFVPTTAALAAIAPLSARALELTLTYDKLWTRTCTTRGQVSEIPGANDRLQRGRRAISAPKSATRMNHSGAARPPARLAARVNVRALTVNRGSAGALAPDQNRQLRYARSIRGSSGWKWRSSTPSSGSPGNRDA